jgi:hypothetical protein
MRGFRRSSDMANAAQAARSGQRCPRWAPLMPTRTCRDTDGRWSPRADPAHKGATRGLWALASPTAGRLGMADAGPRFSWHPLPWAISLTAWGEWTPSLVAIGLLPEISGGREP